jgi:hypothetical protein
MSRFVRQRLFWLKKGMYDFWSVLYKMHDAARHNIEIFAVLGCYAALIGRFYQCFGTACQSHIQESCNPGIVSLLGQVHSLL